MGVAQGSIHGPLGNLIYVFYKFINGLPKTMTPFYEETTQVLL